MKHGNLKLAALADIAIDAIRTLVTDPNTPPAVRLRAAKLIVDSISNDDNNDDSTATAQQSRNAAPSRPGPVAVPNPKLHPPPKIGSNDYCPCGSGLKFKKCCLTKWEHGGRPDPSQPARPVPVARDATPATAASGIRFAVLQNEPKK
jgi:SEC-C motif